jgi:hypothetical protein
MRNNADFHGSRFHVSPKGARAGIEAGGLRKGDAYVGANDSNKPGVWVSDEPLDDHEGDDVYSVKGSFPKETDLGESTVIHHDVPASAVKRVGHVASDGVHWHLEERCNG